MENITSEFGLDASQTLLLYSLEYKIIKDDVNATLKESREKGMRKNEWLVRWTIAMNNSLKSLGVKDRQIITDFNDVELLLFNTIANNCNQKAWRYMILLECCLFTPYYPLGTEKADKQLIKGLKPIKKELRISQEQICILLNIEKKYIDTFKNGYNSAVKKLTNYGLRIFFYSIATAFAIIAIVVSFQYQLAPLVASGLYGAAAVNAALAMLGGGAIAAGGFGIIGGQLVVIGGGVLLGTGLSSSLITLFESSPDFTLSQLARLEVVLKEIILGMQHDVVTLQQILLNQQEKINALKKETIRLKADAESNKERIKNLEKSIKYMERFMKTNSNIA